MLPSPGTQKYCAVMHSYQTTRDMPGSVQAARVGLSRGPIGKREALPPDLTGEPPSQKIGGTLLSITLSYPLTSYV